jgi:MinD-like ATPase involved in chromosome partitioning or flagellar assembly
LVINRTRPHGVSHEEVMRTVNQLITADIPYEPGQVNALSEGKPLVMSRPDSLFSRAVLHLARQL